MEEDFKKLMHEAWEQNDWEQAEAIIDEVIRYSNQLELPFKDKGYNPIEAATLAAERRNARDRGEGGKKI